MVVILSALSLSHPRHETQINSQFHISISIPVLLGFYFFYSVLTGNMHFFQKLALLLLPAAALAGAIPYEIRKDFANPKSGVTSKKAFDIHAQEENGFLSYKGTQPGKVVQDGVKLLVLSVGDSITVGYGKGTDGNGYRKRLRKDLSGKITPSSSGNLTDIVFRK